MLSRPRMLLRFLITVFAAVGFPAVQAQDPEPEDPLAAVRDADPLELARVVGRLGDGAVLERLGPDSAFPVRLAAVRASPLLREPERALAPLAELAAGRDPTLAPAAMLAALRIARSLRADALAAREVGAEDLRSAREALETLRDDETARADLRRAAAFAVASLASLLGGS